MTWSAVQFVVVAIGVILVVWGLSISIRDWHKVLATYDVEVEARLRRWRVKGRDYHYRWMMYRGALPVPVDAGVARWRWSLGLAITAAYVRRWWDE